MWSGLTVSSSRAPICNQLSTWIWTKPIRLQVDEHRTLCVYICTHHPKTAMEPQKPECFLASKTLFRMGSKLPGISNHFHIDSGMKPETCHMSLCLMQRYSYTLFNTYQNCQRAMHMVCWIYCLPCITNNWVAKGRDSDIQYSPSVSMCQLYISIYTYVLEKVSAVLRHLTDFQGRNYESMKRHLEIMCTTSWEGKNGWLKMERRSSNRFVSCLVVVCWVCLHWFCFMFCVACPRKEGFESLGCPSPTFKPSSKWDKTDLSRVFVLDFHSWNLGFSWSQRHGEDTHFGHQQLRVHTGPRDDVWLFGCLVSYNKHDTFLIPHLGIIRDQPW